MTAYKVIGTCRVAGVEPGGEVTEEQLLAQGAIIEALIGPHLEPVEDDLADEQATE